MIVVDSQLNVKLFPIFYFYHDNNSVFENFNIRFEKFPSQYT